MKEQERFIVLKEPQLDLTEKMQMDQSIHKLLSIWEILPLTV